MTGVQTCALPICELALGLTALTYNRWKTVLVEVARISNWQAKVSGSKVGTGDVLKGRGVALSSFTGTTAGAVADVSVNVKTGKVTVDHMYIAQDNGVSFYLDGGVNNTEGAVIQGVSRTLVEGLNFDTKYVTGLDWVTYPMLRFKDHPKVTTSILQRFDVPDVTSATLGSNGQIGRAHV